jgi:hypothetical protein
MNAFFMQIVVIVDLVIEVTVNVLSTRMRIIAQKKMYVLTVF